MYYCLWFWSLIADTQYTVHALVQSSSMNCELRSSYYTLEFSPLCIPSIVFIII